MIGYNNIHDNDGLDEYLSVEMISEKVGIESKNCAMQVTFMNFVLIVLYYAII